MAPTVKDEQPPDLSQVGEGAWDGLPANEINVEIIRDSDHATGLSGKSYGEISIHRTSEDH